MSKYLFLLTTSLRSFATSKKILPVALRIKRGIVWALRNLFRKRFVDKNIGKTGPHRLSVEYIFSDFKAWGSGHNAGFSIFVELCRHSSTIFDVGAHIGLTTLAASSVVTRDSKIVAFEASPINYGILVDHLAANDAHLVTPVCTLLGEVENKSVSFFEHQDSSGMNSLVHKVFDSTKASDWKSIEQPMTTLDAYCSKNQLKPDLIKIDVEGAEYQVLLGGLQIINECQPAILLSVHPSQLSDLGYGASELATLISGMAYDVLTTDSNTVVRESLRFCEYLLIPQNTHLDFLKN
jgi:FkbM family methyltransferase